MSWLNRSLSHEMEERVTATVREVIGKAMNDAETMLSKLKSSFDLAAHIAKLRDEIETLKIEKGRKEEEYARKEREIEHKVGLERARQTQELVIAKREAVVSVKEENLAADRKRFEDQMKFHETRFSEEVGYLKNIIGDLAERLPTANVSIKRSEKADGTA